MYAVDWNVYTESVTHLVLSIDVYRLIVDAASQGKQGDDSKQTWWSFEIKQQITSISKFEIQNVLIFQVQIYCFKIQLYFSTIKQFEQGFLLRAVVQKKIYIFKCSVNSS